MILSMLQYCISHLYICVVSISALVNRTHLVQMRHTSTRILWPFGNTSFTIKWFTSPSLHSSSASHALSLPFPPSLLWVRCKVYMHVQYTPLLYLQYCNFLSCATVTALPHAIGSTKKNHKLRRLWTRALSGEIPHIKSVTIHS